MSKENEKQNTGKRFFKGVKNIYLYIAGGIIGISSLIGIIKNFDWIVDKYNSVSTVVNQIPKVYCFSPLNSRT